MADPAGTWRRRATLAGALALAIATGAGCSATGSGSGSGSSGAGSSAAATPSPTASSTPSASGSPSASASPSPDPAKVRSAGPAVSISSIAPTDKSVGVAMPISIVFSGSVSTSQHAQIEKHLYVTTSKPVTGAWHWFGSRRVDFRPKTYWTPGTTVALDARLGPNTYTRDFTIGDDVRTHVYVQRHKAVVTKNGAVVRTMASDAGSPALPTWTGTMAVVNKSPTVRMDSCSVHIACSPSDPNYYDLELPWDVRITWSGTFLHYSSGDPNPGHANGSHGCIHLSLTDAEWYYHLSKPGDPVTVTGSPRPKADADNGYAGFNDTWAQWTAGSATGGFTTTQA